MANGGDVIFNFKGDDKQLQKTTSEATSKLKGLSKTIGKVALAGGVALGGMFAGMVTSSVKARGQIEQSLGGINKLFGKSANEVIKNSQKAYKTAGISANQYMEQVTSFSASLLKGLNGDTEKTAKIADTAIKDMADNANTFGTSMESLQTAYQGFAKQNYTMLDNLKLGYGGTKSEMVKLVKESGVLGEASKDLTLKNFDQKVSFDQIILAINKTQQRLKITGTTAKEANSTLQGSVASLKSSWENLLSGMGTTKEVVESLKPVIKNVSRIAKEAIKAIWDEIKGLIAEALQPVSNWIKEHQTLLTIIIGIVGSLTAALVAYTIAQNIANISLGIYNGLMGIAAAATTAFGAVVAFLTSPITLVVLAIGGLITAGVLLVKNWETVKTKILNVWNGIKTGVGNAANGVKGFFTNMGTHIGNKVNTIKSKLGEFGSKMKDVATNKIGPAIQKVGTFFGQLPGKMWTHLTNAWNKFVSWCTNLATKAKEAAKKAVDAIKNGFTNLPGNMATIGSNIVKGIWNGIGNMAQWLFEKIKSFKDAVLNKFKSFFGIHSPSTLFRDELGVFMAQGIGEGFTDEMGKVSKQMNRAMATVGLGDMFELSPTLNRTMSSSNNVNVQVINNMETDLLGNLVNTVRTYSNGAKNDYNYGMSY